MPRGSSIESKLNPGPHDLEAMAQALEASGDYRVLRRLAPRAGRHAAAGHVTRLGLFVDVETTGLDPARDEIIELAMVPFIYDLAGEVLDVRAPFSCGPPSLMSEPRPPTPGVRSTNGPSPWRSWFRAAWPVALEQRP